VSDDFDDAIKLACGCETGSWPTFAEVLCCRAWPGTEAGRFVLTSHARQLTYWRDERGDHVFSTAAECPKLMIRASQTVRMSQSQLWVVRHSLWGWAARAKLEAPHVN